MKIQNHIVYQKIYIINFIQKFHSKCGINFDIKILIENTEEKNINEICKNFLDMIFFDGDT